MLIQKPVSLLAVAGCALTTIVATASVTSPSKAAPLPAATPASLDASSVAEPAAARSKRMRPGARGSARLTGRGGPVKDTCPGNNKACIKELIANCDKAGGGLSTQPDGGVDCYVVGIHDQP